MPTKRNPSSRKTSSRRKTITRRKLLEQQIVGGEKVQLVQLPTKDAKNYEVRWQEDGDTYYYTYTTKDGAIRAWKGLIHKKKREKAKGKRAPVRRAKRRSNPPVNQAYKKTDAAAIKTIQGSLKFAKMKDTKEEAKKILKDLKAADPTAKDKTRPYQFLKWLIQVFGRDPMTTLDDLSKGKRYLKLIAEAQEGARNPQWAKDPLTVKKFPSINALGTYLQQEGILKLKKTAVKNEPWLREAYKLQDEGSAYVLDINSEVAFVDVMTDKAARSLGKDTEWCTAAGAFENYQAQGNYLIILYFRQTGHRIQYTSTFTESRDEGDVMIDWDSEPYSKWHKDAREIAKIVNKRAEIVGTLPIYSAVKSIGKTGKLNKNYQWLVSRYPNFRYPPIKYIQRNAKRLADFFRGEGLHPEPQKDVRRSRKADGQEEARTGTLLSPASDGLGSHQATARHEARSRRNPYIPGLQSTSSRFRDREVRSDGGCVAVRHGQENENRHLEVHQHPHAHHGG